MHINALEKRLALLHTLEWCPNSPHRKHVMLGQSPIIRFKMQFKCNFK